MWTWILLVLTVVAVVLPIWGLWSVYQVAKAVVAEVNSGGGIWSAYKPGGLGAVQRSRAAASLDLRRARTSGLLLAAGILAGGVAGVLQILGVH